MLQREDTINTQINVKDCLATGSAPTEYRAMIIAKVASLHRYIYTPGTCALVHVTNIENGTLIVADTWRLAVENPDLAPFEAEVEAAMISLNPAAPDASPPPRKHMRLTFDT